MSARTKQSIVRSIALAGSATRGDVVAATGFSRATVTAAIAELRDNGNIVEADGPRASGRGRRARRLSIAISDGVLCAIDLGHGHYCVAVSDVAFKIRERTWVVCDVDASPSAALERALDSLTALVGGNTMQPVLAIAVVVPQPVIARTGSIAATPFLKSWHGLNVVGAVRDRFDVPVVLENDANAGAISEGERADSLIFVKVSTGIGAGIITAGTLVRGSQGQAGEIGHFVVRPEGQLCGCGNRGCLETLASMPALLRSLEPIHGPIGAAAFAQLIRNDDVAALRALRDAGGAIGFALAPVVGALQTERIVISGPQGIPMRGIVSGVRARIEALVHPKVMKSLVVASSSLGVMSPLMGGLQLALAAARTLPAGLDRDAV